MAQMVLQGTARTLPRMLSAMTSPLNVLMGQLERQAAQGEGREEEQDEDMEGEEAQVWSDQEDFSACSPSSLHGSSGVESVSGQSDSPPLRTRQGRRLLHPSRRRSLLQSCGASLALQNASIAGIVSAAPTVSSCSSAAVSLEAAQLAMLLGAVESIEQATVDMQDFTTRMLGTISGLNDVFDAADAAYASAVTAMYAQISNAYGNDTAQVQVVMGLLDQTLASQSSLGAAINASATLLLAVAVNSRSAANTTMLDMESILKGYGLDSLLR